MVAGTVDPKATQLYRLAALTGLLVFGVNAAMSEPAGSTGPVAPNAVPFEFVSGRILFSARVNDSRAATLMLDTGYSINMLSRELVDSLQLKGAGHITIVGIAGEERTDLFEGVKFDLAGSTYSPQRG